MIKLYITVMDSREDGSAITLLEEYQLGFKDIETLRDDGFLLVENLVSKLEEVEKINNQVASPF